MNMAQTSDWKLVWTMKKIHIDYELCPAINDFSGWFQLLSRWENWQNVWTFIISINCCKKSRKWRWFRANGSFHFMTWSSSASSLHRIAFCVSVYDIILNHNLSNKMRRRLRFFVSFSRCFSFFSIFLYLKHWQSSQWIDVKMRRRVNSTNTHNH